MFLYQRPVGQDKSKDENDLITGGNPNGQRLAALKVKALWNAVKSFNKS
jgi:hypothetical protein